MNKLEAIDYFYARQYAYDLLRRIFIEEPSVEFMQYLQNDQNIAHFPFATEDTEMQAAIKEIINYLKNSSFKAKEDTFEDLHWDFTRLFIGPEAPPAAPWESVYVSRDKLLFQENTNKVKDFYECCGFELNNLEYEAADHIGFELDFMFHLSSQSIASLDDSEAINTLLQQQNAFLVQHLLAFTNAFSRNIIEHADTVFYRAAAMILQSFLTHDQQWIEAVLKNQKVPQWQ